jgi:hypothetical protein
MEAPNLGSRFVVKTDNVATSDFLTVHIRYSRSLVLHSLCEYDGVSRFLSTHRMMIWTKYRSALPSLAVAALTIYVVVSMLFGRSTHSQSLSVRRGARLMGSLASSSSCPLIECRRSLYARCLLSTLHCPPGPYLKS